ncbi:uncharacterized protein ND-15 [Planococcus citri]|uniref:uncharacterized protein ND-15 n=1 Tax=Planococcus citri TaxID=170843 RepID=UPI0031F783EC
MAPSKNLKKEEDLLTRVHDEPNASPRILREHEVYRQTQDGRPLVTVFTPFLQTVFTDWFHMPFDMQYDQICGKIERNFYRCMEAYGGNRGFKECRDYIDDYRECTSSDKQKARIKAMIEERRRQFKSGERKEYSKPPRMGSYESSVY